MSGKAELVDWKRQIRAASVQQRLVLCQARPLCALHESTWFDRIEPGTFLWQRKGQKPNALPVLFDSTIIDVNASEYGGQDLILKYQAASGAMIEIWYDELHQRVHTGLDV